MSLDSITTLIIEYRYWILIPLSFIEGPIVAFITGTLAWLGYFNPYIAFAIFIVRDIVVDAFLYFLGRFGEGTRLARRLQRKLGVTNEHFDDVRTMWERHGFKTMFFSKLSYGVSAALLRAAGMVKMNYYTYFRYAILVALAQYGVLFLLGYYFGNTLGTVSDILHALQYIVAAIFIVAIGYYILTRYMRKKLLEEEEDVAKEKE